MLNALEHQRGQYTGMAQTGWITLSACCFSPLRVDLHFQYRYTSCTSMLFSYHNSSRFPSFYIFFLLTANLIRIVSVIDHSIQKLWFTIMLMKLLYCLQATYQCCPYYDLFPCAWYKNETKRGCWHLIRDRQNHKANLYYLSYICKSTSDSRTG